MSVTKDNNNKQLAINAGVSCVRKELKTQSKQQTIKWKQKQNNYQTIRDTPTNKRFWMKYLSQDALHAMRRK